MSEETLRLCDGFPEADEAAWRRLVGKALRGRDFDKVLVAETPDGSKIAPLYRQTSLGAAPSPRPAGRAWGVVQRIDMPDPEAANAQILADLDGGANGLHLVFASSNDARGAGLAIDGRQDFETLFRNVDLEAIALSFSPGYENPLELATFIAYCEARGINPARLDFRAGLDPIGTLAATGSVSTSLENSAFHAASAVRGLARRGFAGPGLLADGRVWHGGGATDGQELAFVAATVIAYLRLMEKHDMAVADAADHIAVTLAADQDQFATIAKFRAMRLIWNNILSACGIAPRHLRLHAETAWRMMTRRDAHVNMLRITIACFSAAIGGADSITVLPFTAALGLPNGFARRMARNTQTILIEESSLHRVGDAAAGSGHVEAATEALAQKAWSILQEIEGEGGIIAALRAGGIQERIAAKWAERQAAIATREAPITGTSEFPDLDEVAPDTLQMSAPPPRKIPGGRLDLCSPAETAPFERFVEAAGSGHSIAAMASDLIRPAEHVEAVEPVRASTMFEELREAADAHAAASGRRASVFLANLGPVAAHVGRATFARNLFAAGGIAVQDSEGFTDAGQAAQAFSASGSRIACICSSDDFLEAMAQAVAGALKAAGAVRVYLAGRPGDTAAALMAAGVDEFIHVGCDARDVLQRAQEAIGITGPKEDPNRPAATGKN